MIWLHLLLCVLPFLAAENATVGTRRMLVHSGDLPESYHMATAASDLINETRSVDLAPHVATTTEAEVTTLAWVTDDEAKNQAERRSDDLAGNSVETNRSEDGVKVFSLTEESPKKIQTTTENNLVELGDKKSTPEVSSTTSYSLSPEVLGQRLSPVTEVVSTTSENNHVEELLTKESPFILEVVEVGATTEHVIVAKDLSTVNPYIMKTTRLEPVAYESVDDQPSSLIVPDGNSDSVSTVLPLSSASGRSFTMDAESTEDAMERRSDDGVTKYVKKKKILTTPRPKGTTEKTADKNDIKDVTDLSDVSERAEPRSFYSFSTSTTESSDVRQTTSTLLISEKIVNNNLLNVIDTSVRPVDEDTTESLLHHVPLASSSGVHVGLASSTPAVAAKNTIRFGDDFSSTGQSDWVPLVSEQVTGPEWPRFVPSTTARATTTEQGRRPTAPRIRFPDERITSSTDPPTQPSSTDSSEMDVASWALATSTITRRPFNSSMVEEIDHVSFVTPPNSTRYSVLRERLQTALARATEKGSAESSTTTERTNFLPREGTTEPAVNATKDQDLKNTIPDTVDSDKNRWRPVVMVTPPPTSTEKSKPTTEEVVPTTRKSDEAATSVFDNIEYTTMFELMKIPTSTQRAMEQNTSESIVTPVVTDNVTDRISGNVVEEEVTVHFEKLSSTEKIVAQLAASKEPTTTEKRYFDTSSSTTSTTSTTEKSDPVIATEENSEIPTEITPVVQKLLDALATKLTTQKVDETTPYEPEGTTLSNEEFRTEESATERGNSEKSPDDNRTIIPVDEPISNASATDQPITDDAAKEMISAYLMLTVMASQVELCHSRDHLRAAILKILSEGTHASVAPDSLVLLNLTPSICNDILTGNRTDDEQVRLRHVKMLLTDERGDFNKNLGEIFLRVWGETGLDFPLQIVKVDLVTPLPEGELEPKMGGGVAAAIAISVIAGLCLILLGMLFVIMKRRQKKFNYGQRCTPVSLDAYSLDSVSIRNSSRRKGGRASKRSYGNPAFDDPDIPSHPLNFAGLANFSAEKEQMYEEFSNIPQVAPRPDELPPGAEAKNRYANVLPLPETRVVLSKREGDMHSDYINANFVRDLAGKEKMYIGAQAPLESTLADWWRLIWEQQVKLILMVTALHENGIEKCAEYLPPNEVTDSLRLFGDFHVTLKKRDVKDKYIVSLLQLKNMDGNLIREVTHVWYVGWPDTGVPVECNSLIAFLIEARSLTKSSNHPAAPILVHCSPGTGRTGVVIACDMLIRGFEQKRVVDIPRCVYQIRRCRAGAVQTRDQYAFIYQVLNAYATKLTGGAGFGLEP